MKKLLLLVAILALLAGCKSSTKATGPSADFRETITAGWEAFQVHDWANALALFNTAVQVNPSSPEGWIGLGWSEARANSHNWQSAITDLNRALAISSNSNDARAGIAYAYYGAGVYTSADSANADSAATIIISRSSIWTFQYDESITLQDLRVLRASCRFNSGNFATALSAIQEVDPFFNVDVTTAAGRAALAEEIERWLAR